VNVGRTTVKISRTLFAPAAWYSLLSVGQMTDEKDWIFVFDKRECRIYDAQSRELIGRTPKRGRLYKLGGSMTKCATPAVADNGRAKQGAGEIPLICGM